MKALHLDFETYSEADIKDVGAWAYSVHPSTKVILMAWAFDNDRPQVWQEGDPLPPWAVALRDGEGVPDYVIHAQNDFFERCIMGNTLKWFAPPPRFWHDTAAQAAVLSLPRPLADCGEALGLNMADQKSKEGAKLIALFSRPAKSKKDGLARRMPADYPAEWETFKRYNAQDVVAERANGRAMAPLSKSEREVWELDRKINLRGVRVDMPRVHDAIAIREKATSKIIASVAEKTGGQLLNIMSRPQLLEYMSCIGVDLENAQKEYLKDVLQNGDLPEHAKEILGLRLSIAKSSLAKYDMLVSMEDKGRLYGLLRYHGAGTGRWTGNGFQPQNLTRPSFKDTEACISLFKYRDDELLADYYGDALEALSSCVRGMIIPSKGNRLVVSDYSQIESRMLAWLAGAEDKLDVFRSGKDVYKLAAAAAYKKPYESITKAERGAGKVIDLACGYQGAKGAFSKMAKNLGLHFEDDEIMPLIKNWREGNPKIVSLWHNVERAAVKATANPGEVVREGKIAFKVFNGFLNLQLPSGRRLYYHKPHIYEGNYGPQVAFWGVNSTTKKYCTQYLYGGLLVENISQASCRDILVEAMINAEKEKYPVILNVYDELIADVPKSHGSLKEFNEIMCRLPKWAAGLPINAEGYEAERYRKD